MKRNKTYFRTSIAALGMLLMILDSKTVVFGASQGIQICFNLVIPSLFPYLFFSNILTSSVHRSGSLFLIGMLGGYPTGAQAVRTAYDLGNCSKESAEKMLGYCNLAGPAFIFGMLSAFFTKAYLPWILWGIHLLSGLIIYWFFQDKRIQPKISAPKRTYSLSDILLRSVRTISLICGWVFLFRILLNILEVRLLDAFPLLYSTIISGLLELTNGCCKLPALSEPFRFVLCSAFLGFGGICVLLQTVSITKELSIKYYLYGKILHCVLSVLFSLLLVPILF